MSTVTSSDPDSCDDASDQEPYVAGQDSRPWPGEGCGLDAATGFNLKVREWCRGGIPYLAWAG